MAGRVGPSGTPDGMMGGAVRGPLGGQASASGGLETTVETFSTVARGTVAASASSEGARASRRERSVSDELSGSSDEEGLKWGEDTVEADSRPLGQEPETQKLVSRIREGLWALLDDPNSSPAAYFLAVLIMLLIGVSSTAFVLETLPDFDQSTDDDIVWSTIELVCIICFTFEFVGRVISTPRLGHFIKSPLNVIDFLAIMPFYVELAMGSSATGGSSAVFRIIRLVRVFRVFKLSRYLSWVKVFTKAMATSFQPLLMLLVVILIGTVLFSTAIFYAEHGQWDERQQCFVRFDNKCTPFISIPAAFWWCIITMTTVGYGDEVPITPLGKVIAVVTSFCGILVLAVPITVISTNFNEQYDKLKRSRQRLRAQMMLLKNQFKTKRTGLDAMLDEVEELVQRNTMELRKDVEELFEQSALELNEEIKSLVRLAFKQRRKRAQALEQGISLRQSGAGSFLGAQSRGSAPANHGTAVGAAKPTSPPSPAGAPGDAQTDDRRTPGRDGARAAHSDSPADAKSAAAASQSQL
ncbi:hypothetical protein FNF27_03306 [Cafeteria roenbergensis]|uniref:Ion transport domain-containing protein n=1 Tax=Cafeteria roenbergensis TaxID=33653 RepID=A0A5A8EDC8_CAFRO|nr:hypothetical protein FNF27_03306 [Cafeteria roenbergensis]